jgi:DNA topoisomerase-6 subunit A
VTKHRSTNDPRQPGELDRAALALIHDVATAVKTAIDDDRLPEIHLPRRNLDNVRYDAKTGYLELLDGEKHRTLDAATVKTFAQTLRLMALCKELVEHGDFATKREAYYVSKNWGEARFRDQPESDAVLDDLEALASTRGLLRDELRFYAEEHGGSVAGELTVIDVEPESGGRLEIDCRRLGAGSYSIPRSVERLRFESGARFVLAIETGGMFQRLSTHRFWERERCILVEMAGVPTRATRRFVRRLSDACRLPVYCFSDCDPYGFANIYRTLKVGSGNAAHVNRFYSVPQARFLGVTPDDIVTFGLADATHPLDAGDVKRARDALSHDPFFQAEPRWQAAFEQLIQMGVRAEQQALAKWGLNYVIEEYLPKKLAHPEAFLP